MATRLYLRERLQRELGEVQGVAGFDDPLSLDDHLNDEVDALAEACYCHHGSYSKDIVSGQASYCAPPVFYITRVLFSDSGGAVYGLHARQPRSGSPRQSVPALWRNSPRSGSPTSYLALGVNTIRVFPTPDYSTAVYSYTDLVIGTDTTQVSSAARPFTSADVGRLLTDTDGTGFTTGAYTILSVASGVATLNASLGTAASTGGTATLSSGALTIEGYAKPGKLWPLDTDSQPIAFGDDAVLTGAKVRRCQQFAGDRHYDAKLPALMAQSRALRGKLERAAALLIPDR